MNDPCVSIILINYNGREDTIECVNSLLNINYSNFNIVIVDNCSTQEQNFGEELNKTDKVSIIWSNENLGFSGGNNLGIKYCFEHYKPDYYLLINNDTIVHPDFLKHLVSTAKQNKNAGLICGKIYYNSPRNIIWSAGGYIDQKTGWTHHYGADEIDIGQYDEERNVKFATGCLLLIPRQIISNVGLLDENYFLYFEDVDYSVRVLNKGYDIVYCPDSVIYHKVSSSTKQNGKVFTYYFVRNSFIFINKYGCSKLRSYISHMFQYIKDILRHRSQAKVVFKATVDFLRGTHGKAEL